MLKFRGGQLAHEKNEFLPHENYPLYTVFGIYRDHTIIPTIVFMRIVFSPAYQILH